MKNIISKRIFWEKLKKHLLWRDNQLLENRINELINELVESEENRLLSYLKSSELSSFPDDYKSGYNDAIKDIQRYLNN